jgi:hypothetical protein
MQAEPSPNMQTKLQLVQLDSLFTIRHGNKFDLNKMHQCPPTDTAVAFVGRSAEGNGIVGFVTRHRSVEPYKAGLITVALGGSALSSFVQPRPFYTAQNIDVLEAKVPMAAEVKMYYCLCIEANRFRYSTFGREANRTLKKLLVPATHCVPAWVNGTLTSAIQELVEDLGAAARV